MREIAGGGLKSRTVFENREDTNIRARDYNWEGGIWSSTSATKKVHRSPQPRYGLGKEAARGQTRPDSKHKSTKTVRGERYRHQKERRSHWTQPKISTRRMDHGQSSRKRAENIRSRPYAKSRELSKSDRARKTIKNRIGTKAAPRSPTRIKSRNETSSRCRHRSRIAVRDAKTM